MLYSINNVTKTYEMGKINVNALNGVTLEISEGGFYAFVGASGSGKSTLLHMLGTIDKPTSGDVIFCGKNFKNMNENNKAELRNEKIGFVFQKYFLIPTLSAYENVELPLLQFNSARRKQAKKIVRDLLESVGMERFSKHKPNELSGGQQQRIAIARALVMNPRVVLADEPTANLDSENGEEILKLMQKINRNQKTTFIFATHDKMLSEMCDTKIELKDGVVI